jgi:hypothetical protein
MSILMSIAIFFFTYNISQIIYYRFDSIIPSKEINFMENLRIVLSIISFSLHMFISITFLAYTRDLIFSFIMIYLLVGYFVSQIFLNGKAAREENIACISLITLNMLSFFYSIYNHKMEAFGVVKNDDVDEVIDNMIKKKTLKKI